MPTPRLRFIRLLRHAALPALIALCSLGMASARSEAGDLEQVRRHEVLQGPIVRPSPVVRATSPAAIIPFGRFTSIQVNVDPSGADILGDLANEPSIAVDPTHPNRMAIGWRQFDDKNSIFREAGYGYSTNGGLTWSTGKVEPGVFRSDPVLQSDEQGKFFYLSAHLDLTTFEITTQLFASTDQGATWGPGVQAFGGDKEWFTIDRTNGIGHGYIYESWSGFPHSYSFSRSIDGGQTFQAPVLTPVPPIWGTMDVGPDGTVYTVGISGDMRRMLVSRSTKSQNAAVPTTFVTTPVDLGGTMIVGPPNGSSGLLGQPWIVADQSPARAGWVYVLCSVQTKSDPLDVMFIRSSDGGHSWSKPVRVNDDPVGNHAYQWFGTMSVAPNGRIDAVWNDTRGSADSTKSALYYSYSNDGGMTWSPNEQASPVWDSALGGFQTFFTKVGDYYQMISHDSGADLAWAATFNGGHDIYYMRIPAPSSIVAEQGTMARSSTVADGSIGLRLSPNPFASSTAINFDVPGSGGRAKVEVFDAGGRRIATLLDGFVKAGPQTVRWTGVDDAGRALNSGIYLCRVETAATSKTLKLMLMR